MKPLKLAVRELSNVVEETLSANNLQKTDIDWLVPHQANLRIITATAKKLEMDMSQVVVTLDRTANTSAATVPTALDEAVRRWTNSTRSIAFTEAFGGGWTWGFSIGAILIILLESRQNFKSAVKFDALSTF